MMKNIKILMLLLISTGGYAQMVGNVIENRIVSGAGGNHIFLLDEEYIINNQGRLPEPFENNTFLIVERSTDGKNFAKVGELRPVENIDQLTSIWGEDMVKTLLADTTTFNFKDEEELVAFFQKVNNPFAQLYLLPIKLLKTIGLLYIDKTAKAGVEYTYRVKYRNVDKIIMQGKVLTGSPNKTLMNYKFNFNQLSLKAIDSLITGSWVVTGNNKMMIASFDVYGKRTFDTEFTIIDTINPRYLGDTVMATVYHRVKPAEAWQVYIQPKDLINNVGQPSDTATLVSVSKGNLPFVKNFKAEDSENAISLSWDPLPKQPFLSGYLLSRNADNEGFAILDTIPLNTTEYFDYDVENGIGYNYEIQPISNPVGNIVATNFTPVRASGSHQTVERVLPPQVLTVAQEGEFVRVSWTPVDSPSTNFYVISANSSPDKTSFQTLGNVKTDTTFLDTLNRGDLGFQTRFYAVQTVSYNLKLSDLSNIEAITPTFNPQINPPIGIILRDLNQRVKISWEIDLASEDYVSSYKVYRISDQGEPTELTKDSVLTQRFFVDDISTTGKYNYAVKAVSHHGNESDLSTIESVYIKVKDEIIGERFTTVKYRNIPPGIEISWLVPANTPVEKIAIYRLLTGSEDSDYELLSIVPLAAKRYWDKTAQNGETYLYAVSAINREGIAAQKEFSQLITKFNVDVNQE